MSFLQCLPCFDGDDRKEGNITVPIFLEYEKAPREPSIISNATTLCSPSENTASPISKEPEPKIEEMKVNRRARSPSLKGRIMRYYRSHSELTEEQWLNIAGAHPSTYSSTGEKEKKSSIYYNKGGEEVTDVQKRIRMNLCATFKCLRRKFGNGCTDEEWFDLITAPFSSSSEEESEKENIDDKGKKVDSFRKVAVRTGVKSSDHSLYCAAAGGHLKEVKRLLESGFNPSDRTICDWCPLHWAANNDIEHGHQIVKLLVEYGADVNQVSDTGLTPLDLAKRAGKTENVKFLEMVGAKTGRSRLSRGFQ